MATRSTSNQEIFRYLIDNPSNVTMLEQKFHFAPYTIRSLMDALEKTDRIEKRKVGHTVWYHVKDKWKRKAPLFSLKLGPHRTIGYINEILFYYGKPTSAHTAASFFPILAARLLYIGNEANESFIKGEAEFNKSKPKLNRELNLLKKELNNHQGSLKRLSNYLKQLELNEELWTPEGLMQYFNVQLDKDNRPIPPLDITEALRIVENERQKQ